ncbi:MAG: ATP-binding protein [Candidatus Omnitrophota bacterium]|jgi:serine/threonine-protein kinase RsbW
MVITLQLSSDLKIIPQISRDIIKQIKSKNISDDDLFDIRLALEEALVNAIKHGNKGKPSKKVFLKVLIKAHMVSIQIKDEGEGFDSDELTSPLLTKNLKKTRGRGIFLIKNLMDKVEFFDGGSGIKMVKLMKQQLFKPKGAEKLRS